MRILFLTTHFNTGGITSYIMTLSKELVAVGHQVYVGSSGGNMVDDLERIGAKHIKLNIRTKSILSWKVFVTIPAVKKLVEECQIDIIHAHTRVTQCVAHKVSRRQKIPYVSTCHGFFRPRWIRKTFPCWGQKVIAISDQVASHLKDDFNVDGERVEIVRNGIDLENFSSLGGEAREEQRQKYGYQKKFVIGIIARLSDVKGHCVLIDAFAEVIKKVAHAQLAIVGHGKEEAALKDQVKQLRLTERINFFPAVNKTTDFLNIFDCFVLPSLQEGLGLSVMEAQAAGLPVIASRVGGVPSLIDDGKTGLLVDPGNAERLAQAISRVATDVELAQSLALQARQKSEREYGSHEMMEKIVKVYEMVGA